MISTKTEDKQDGKLACAILSLVYKTCKCMCIICGFINKKEEELTITTTLEIMISYYDDDYFIEPSTVFMHVTNKNHDGIDGIRTNSFSNENAKTMWDFYKTLLNKEDFTCTAKLVNSRFSRQHLSQSAPVLSLESIRKLREEISKQSLQYCFPRLLKNLAMIIESSNKDEEADGIEMRPMQ